MRWRSVILLAIAALVAGWVGCSSDKSEKGAVLAKVGSKSIREADLDSRIQDMPASARPQFEGLQGRRTLLDRMIEEETFFQAAEAAGFARKPEVEEEVERTRRTAMLRAYYQAEVLEKAKPTPEQVEEYYRTHLEDYRTEPRVRVAHILTRTKAEAERVRGLAEMGRDFATLAANYSIDEKTKGNGGTIPGFLSEGKQVPLLGKVDALVTAALDLREEGEISPVVESPLGFHVLKALELHPGGLVPLDDVRDVITQRLTESKSKEIFDAKFAELSKKYHVKYADEFNPPTVQELFDQAQKTTGPKDRIKIYEQILQMYPDDPRAYEAQFMIGFTYSEELGNLENARAAFEAVVNRYPDCELYDSAKWMLENLGKEDVSMEGVNLPEEATVKHGSELR